MKTAEAKSASQQPKTAAQSFFNQGQEHAFFSEQTSERTSFFPSTAPNLIQATSIAGQTPFFSPSPTATIQRKCTSCEAEEPSQVGKEPAAEPPTVQRMPGFESEGAVQSKAAPKAAVTAPPTATPQTQQGSDTKELEQQEEAIAETPQIQMMPAFSSADDPGDGDDSNAEQPPVQFRLTVGQPGDAYEQEADQIAAQVMTMPAPLSQPAIQRQTEGEDNEIQPKTLANRITPLVQRKPVPTKVQLKEQKGSSDASPNLESRLNSNIGGGNPLPDGVRSFMEPRFGADFSQVRVHTDSSAAQMNKDLQAQAFTHGSDVYFGAGKSPGKNDLTAHELTHTVQQGAAKGSVQKKASAIQKAPGDSPKTFRKINEGTMEKNQGKYEIILTNFPVKQYAYLPFSQPYLRAPNIERKTKQASIWREKMAQPIKDSLAKVVPDDIKQEPSLTLEIKNLSSNSKKQTAVVGNFDTLAKAILVPFWDKGGHPMIHQIEHKIDWQVMGDKADAIGNFLLIDAESNRSLGSSVRKNIRDRGKKVIDHYRQSGLNDVVENVDEALSQYVVSFEVNTFQYQKVNTKSIISSSDLQPNAGNNPIDQNKIQVHKTEIPADHLILKTSKKGEGYIIPYDFKNEFIELEIEKGSDGEKKLKAVILKNIAKDPKGNLDLAKPDKPLFVTKESAHIYKAKTEGYAGVLKNIIRLKQLSPIEWDEVDFDFKNGWSGGGKVITDVELLKNVDIQFGLQNSIFIVEATVTSTALKDKLPKPFQIDFCSLTIAANSVTGLSVIGSLGFSIDKLGKGILSAGVDRASVFLEGKFNFNSKWFNPAEVNFNYKKGEWSIGGKIGIQKGLIPGVKDATLEAHYSKDTFSIAGLAHLSVPGIDTISLVAQFDDKGNFAFTAVVDLKAMKGIKSGNVKVTITSKEGEEGIKLRVEGKASPDFPSIRELNTELSVLYDNGIFKVGTTVNYKKGRFDGTINVGVTNQSVDDKGNPQGEPNQAGEVVVFGFGQLTVDIFKGNTGTIKVRLTPDKEVLIAGEIVLQNLSPFGDGVDYDKEILPFPQLEIPLVGIPGISVSAFITGGVHFKFNWQPLILKMLKVEFKETNINELESVQLDITGSVGSIATAEVYMAINAGLKARVLIATLSGSLGGEAGLGVTAEAGGDIQATWNMEKGLQLKEIMAHLDVTPRAVFRLTGNVSVDLDLWVTSVNLYYHKWIFAEKEIDMSGLTLKANFPIRFDEKGDLIKPEVDKIGLEKPNFTGDQGKAVLDKAINGDAEKELAAKKEKIRATIKSDLRDPKNDLTPTEYTEKMKEKYEDSPELQEFVIKTIEDESRLIEYEQFDKQKDMIRQANIPLANKFNLVNVFNLFYSRYVTNADIEAFKAELVKIEEDKKLKAEQAKQEQLALENAQKQNASKPESSKPKSKTKKAAAPKARITTSS
jgi:Domain of unknown function (DUF4157)